MFGTKPQPRYTSKTHGHSRDPSESFAVGHSSSDFWFLAHHCLGEPGRVDFMNNNNDGNLVDEGMREAIAAGAREYATTSFGGSLLDVAGLPLATVRARPTSDDQTTWIVYLDPGEHLDIQARPAKFLEAGGHQAKRRYVILRIEDCQRGAEPHFDLKVSAPLPQ